MMSIHTHGHIFEVNGEAELTELLGMLSSGQLQMAVWLYATSWKPNHAMKAMSVGA